MPACELKLAVTWCSLAVTRDQCPGSQHWAPLKPFKKHLKSLIV